MRALLLVALVGAPAFAESAVLPAIAAGRPLRVGMHPGSSPFVTVGDEAADLRKRLGAAAAPEVRAVDGRAVAGFDVDLVAEAARALGRPLEITLVDKFEDLLPGLRAGRYDLVASGVTRTLERAVSVAFTDAYFASGLALVTHKPERFSTLEAVQQPGIKVAFRTGTTAEAFVKKELPQCVPVPAASDGELLTAVDDPARADVVAVDYLFARDAEVRERLKSRPAVIEDRRFTVEQLGFAVRQGDPDWLGWLNLFLRQVRGSGAFHKLAARYNAWFRSER
jgi:polar amino acid transport system substrate-binding protein